MEHINIHGKGGCCRQTNTGEQLAEEGEQKAVTWLGLPCKQVAMDIQQQGKHPLARGRMATHEAE